MTGSGYNAYAASKLLPDLRDSPQLLKFLGLHRNVMRFCVLGGLFVWFWFLAFFLCKYFYFSGKILKCHILLNVILQSDNQVCLKLFHTTHTCIIAYSGTFVMNYIFNSKVKDPSFVLF